MEWSRLNKLLYSTGEGNQQVIAGLYHCRGRTKEQRGKWAKRTISQKAGSQEASTSVSFTLTLKPNQTILWICVRKWGPVKPSSLYKNVFTHKVFTELATLNTHTLAGQILCFHYFIILMRINLSLWVASVIFNLCIRLMFGAAGGLLLGVAAVVVGPGPTIGPGSRGNSFCTTGINRSLWTNRQLWIGKKVWEDTRCNCRSFSILTYPQWAIRDVHGSVCCNNSCWSLP